MPADKYSLTEPPADEREHELWLQHAAGFILLRDVREYARARLAPDIDERARAVALKAIDDALYGLMMVADGVGGHLRNDQCTVRVGLVVAIEDEETGTSKEMNLIEGDGMCMGYHGWIEGDFGTKHPARRDDEA